MGRGIIKILFLLGMVWPLSGQAALFYSENKSPAVVGEDLVMSIKIDTQGQSINAVEGDLFLSPDLQLVDIFDNNSVVNFWVEKPQYNNGKVHFSGIIPGGFVGVNNLFRVVIKAKSAGQQQISFANLLAYLNDGQGTAVVASDNLAQLDFVVSQELPSIEVKISDNEIPENFTPIISRLDQIEAGVYFLIFATQDKGSGIDHYEVREGWRGYQLAASPYRLQNQELNQDIFVKAIDKNGNERVVKVLALHDKTWYENFWFYVIILAVITLFSVTKKIRQANAQKQNKN